MKCELAAALLHRPTTLFLDEPTIGLDVRCRSRSATSSAITNARHEATVLLTSHYMDDVVALCPRIIVIDAGRLIHDGDLRGLIKAMDPDKRVSFTLTDGAGDVELARLGSVLARDGQRITLRVPERELPVPSATCSARCTWPISRSRIHRSRRSCARCSASRGTRAVRRAHGARRAVTTLRAVRALRRGCASGSPRRWRTAPSSGLDPDTDAAARDDGAVDHRRRGRRRPRRRVVHSPIITSGRRPWSGSRPGTRRGRQRSRDPDAQQRRKRAHGSSVVTARRAPWPRATARVPRLAEHLAPGSPRAVILDREIGHVQVAEQVATAPGSSPLGTRSVMRWPSRPAPSQPCELDVPAPSVR